MNFKLTLLYFLTSWMYFNQIWDSGYPYVEPFETDPKNQILAKFGQNDGLIWPILGQILKKNQIIAILYQKVVLLNFGTF